MGSGRWYEAWAAVPARPRPEPPWQPRAVTPVLLLVGYPVAVGLLVPALLGRDDADGWTVVLRSSLAVPYLVGLAVWPRLFREARRWPADPLPRRDR